MIGRWTVSLLSVLLFATAVFASDVSGIWIGQEQGRRGEPQDIAFRFKMNGSTLTGTLFGDEFDIPIGEASIDGDQIRFTVTTRNYYSGSKTVFRYTGVVNERELELVRERVPTPEDKTPNRVPAKQTLKLKRID
jgi:hypothetical protein